MNWAGGINVCTSCAKAALACIRHVNSEDDRLPQPQISRERRFPLGRLAGGGVTPAWLSQAEIACGLALQSARHCRKTPQVRQDDGSLCVRAASKVSGDEAYCGATAGRLR